MDTSTERHAKQKTRATTHLASGVLEQSAEIVQGLPGPQACLLPVDALVIGRANGLGSSGRRGWGGGVDHVSPTAVGGASYVHVDLAGEEVKRKARQRNKLPVKNAKQY